MKLEVIKTYILIILVGMSLLLTFNIWSYKPNSGLMYDKQGHYVNENDYYIEGKEQTKRDVVVPNEIIFHHLQKNYAFKDPKNSEKLYKNMHDWTLYDFKIRDLQNVPNEKYQIELRFPTAMPMGVINSLFHFNDNIDTGAIGSFKRMFITFNPEKLVLRFHFLSLDGRKEATAVVNDATKFEYLWETISNLKGMQELISVGPEKSAIYFPRNPVSMEQHTFSVNATNPKKLVNALFNDPSLVKRNMSNEKLAYYTDGTRQMKISQDRRIMWFTNPSQTEIHRMTAYELLDKSIENINEHRGWTGKYYLDSLDTADNNISYLLHYDAYPVISAIGLTTIEQRWRNQELYQYSRPLFSINNSLLSEPVKLPSGEEIRNYVKKNYHIDNVTDLRIGYRLKFQKEDTAADILLLEPAWFIKYNGNWNKIDLMPHHDGIPEAT
ncbi:two-component system activity regulator YycH [Virgibacillus sp. 179-BFC.A HS]|uniref:Two-component system activity regulator YycH n=1 Tax=Tigheibacillus jepli TaxID=3035914 RepID=A0ABU5CE98_9BACI|nr:two-component system activity regulator YycH [Virgibacillus sp. 179-BFC.A HS]MDY0404144.1 two-component system activity regulator YycH [Virgibacillus sp. 179-BFC.A HS]